MKAFTQSFKKLSALLGGLFLSTASLFAANNPPGEDPEKPIIKCGKIIGYTVGCIEFAQPFGKNVFGTGDGVIKLLKMKPTLDLYDPSVLYYTGSDGLWIWQDQTSGGKRTFSFLDTFGQFARYEFSANATEGMPTEKYVLEKTRAYLLDGSGVVVPNAAGNNAVFVELRFSDSSKQRYSLTTKQIVGVGDANGRFINLADVPQAARTEIIRNENCLRQIKSGEGLADITRLSGDNGFVLKLYGAGQVGVKTNGVYAVTGEPYRTITFSNPEPENPNPLKMFIVDTWGTRTHQYLFTYQETLDDWVLKKDGGASAESKELLTPPGANPRIYRRILKDASDTIVSEIRTTEFTTSWGGTVETNKTIDPNGLNYQTNSTYNLASGSAGYGKLKEQTNPDGSWFRYVYDSQNRVSKWIRPWLDASLNAAESASQVTEYQYVSHDSNDVVATNDTRPRTVIERTAGIETRRTYYVYATNVATGEHYEIAERVAAQNAAYGATGSLRTTTTYYGSAAGIASAGRVKAIQKPDNTLMSYEYATSGSGTDFAFTTTQTQGTVSSPAGVAAKTLRKVTTQNAAGRVLQEQTQVYAGSGYVTMNTVQHTYTADGFLSQSIKDGRPIYNATYNSGLKTSEADETGIVKNYTYDTLDRIATETKVGIGTQPDIIATYNRTLGGLDCGCDADLQMTVSGGGLSLTSSVRKNQVGQITQQIDQAGLVTSTAYTYGGRVSTTLKPNTAVEVRETYLDGQIKSITGSGVVAQYYTYGVNSDGTRWSQVNQVSTDGPRWEQMTTDFLGRTAQIEKPGFGDGVVIRTTFSYNALGQVSSQTIATIGGVSAKSVKTVIFTYNTLGEQISSATTYGTEPAIINLSARTFQQEGSVWFAAEVSGIQYLENNQSKTVVTGIMRRQLSNFQGDIISYSESYAPPIASGNSMIASALANLSSYANKTTQTITLNRDAKSVVITTALPDSTQPSVKVEVNGLLTSSTSSGNSGTELFQYDALGRRVGNKLPNHANYATMVYDEKGRVSSRSDAGGFTTSYSYYTNGEIGAGKLRYETNSLGNITFYEYDLLGNETKKWGSATYPIVQIYNAYGERITLRTFRDNGLGFVSAVFPNFSGDDTVWTRDAATGILLQKLYADGKGPSYTYYADGVLKTRTWARKDANNNPLTTTYAYTQSGQLSNVDYSDSTPDVIYSYDALGRLINMTDGIGVHAFSYDVLTQKIEQETLSGTTTKKLRRKFDNLGRTMGYVLFDEAETTGEKVVLTAASYAYDEKGNLSQVNGDTVPETFGSPAYDVTALSPSNFTYTRLENSSLIASVVGPTHSVTNTYEQNRNVLSSKQNKITVGVNSNGTVSQYDYTSNSIGQRVARGQSGIAFSQSSSDTFSYNTRGEVVNSSNNQTALYNRSYSYDAIGNRTTYLEGEQDAPVNSFTYSSNSLGQYTEIQKTSSVPPSVETLAYDEDGNVLSIGSGAAYQWDCENRLVKIISGSNAINFAYDGIGRRVEKKFISPAGTVTTTYFYDNCNLIYEKAQTQGVESSTWKTYVWGLDLSNSLYGAGGVGGLLSATIHGDGMSRHSFLFDGNGNVSEVLSGAGEVLAHYEYDAFGNTIFNSNATFENSFRFATKAFDVETNLYYYGYRFYVPSLGRWLSRDPMEEGLHFLLPLFKAYLDPMKNAFSSYYDSAMYLSSYNSMINTYDILGLSGQESNCRSGSNTLSFELPGVFNTLAKFLGGGISIEMYHSVNFTHCDLCCPNGESGTSDTVTTALGISFSGEVPISFPPLPGGFGLVLQLSLSAQGGSEFKYDSCTGEKTENGCFSLSWSAAAGACAPQSSSAPIRMCITCGVSQTYTKCIGESPQNEISGTCKVSFKTWFSTTEFTLYP